MRVRGELSKALTLFAVLNRDWVTFPSGLLFRHIAGGAFFVIALGLLMVLKNLGASVPQEGQQELFKRSRGQGDCIKIERAK